MKRINSIYSYIKKNSFIIVVFLIFLLPRLIGLGWDEWNVDAPRWQLRSDRFAIAVVEGNFAKTYQSYHPGVTLMWISGFSKFVFYKVFELVFHYKPYISPGYIYPEKFFIVSLVAKLPLVLAISFLLTYSANLLKKLTFDKKYLYVFSLMLSLEPYFLGITRFMHLTGLESSFVFASFTSFYYYLATSSIKKKYFILSALFLGLGILTKLSSVILLPFLLALGFYFSIKNLKSFNIKSVGNIIWYLSKKYLIFVLLVVIVFLAFFPAAWIDPFNVIYLMKWKGLDDTAFTDQPHHSVLQNRFTYYYEIFFFKSLGLTLISFLAAITLLALKKIKDINVRQLLLAGLCYVIYYFLVLSFPTKQMTRYMVVVYPFIIMLSSYAVYYFAVYLNNRWKYLAVVVAAYYLVMLSAIYPVFSTYHSELIGGYLGYSKLDTLFNDGEHYLQLADYLNTSLGPDAYDSALILMRPNRDLSVGPAFYGRTYIKSLQEDKKFKNIYIAVEYDSKDKIWPGCEYLTGFGHRWPFNFEFLSLYKCPGN